MGSASDAGGDKSLEVLWERVSHSASGETVGENLIDTLMRAAIEYAGVERALLIVTRRDQHWIEAEALAHGSTVSIELGKARITAANFPESVLHHVVRMKDSVLLHQALETNPFSADEYLTARQPRSLFCLPLLKQTGLIGAIYLENTLTPTTLVPARLAVVKLLATEAAMSVENTRLSGEVQEREAKARRLIDNALDAVLSMDGDGKVTEWNAQAETMFGWRREEALGRLLSELLIPQQYRDAHENGLRGFLSSGVGPLINRRIEITAVRRDGTEFPVEVSVVPYRIDGDWEFSGFVRDITDKKVAEATARRYREVEMELAHANRVATMGQMTASIAHEVNQPIGAAVTNAHAALRWLGAAPPNIEEVRQALCRIVTNGNRATEVLSRIRAFLKKAPPRQDSLNINAAVLEVVALTRSEAAKHRISVDTQLAESLPCIQGDRVQLQQVILNLIINAIEAISAAAAASRLLKITSALSDSSAGVSVAFQDSGPGVPAASLERIFQPFFTTKAEGLGMGLSICRSIIEAHGGRLWADAAHPTGAVFAFSLPMRPHDTP
jgi:PAS domain S-box-containing protein